jgi:hypothetical protein
MIMTKMACPFYPLALFLLVVVFAVGCENFGAAGKRSAAPSGGKGGELFDMSADFHASQKLHIDINQIAHILNTAGSKHPVEYKKSTFLDETVTIGPASESGIVRLSVQLTDLRLARSEDGKTSEFNWRKPPSKEVENRINRCRNALVVYNLDTKTGRTTVIDDKEFSENFARQTVEHESQSDKEKRLRWDTYMYIRETAGIRHYLPDSPKRIGESWTFDGPARALTTIFSKTNAWAHEVTNCTLKEVRVTPQSRMAVISVSGLLENEETHTLRSPISGEITFNLDTHLMTNRQIEFRQEDSHLSSQFKFTVQVEPMHEETAMGRGQVRVN